MTHSLKNGSAADRLIRMSEIRDPAVYGRTAMSYWDEAERTWLHFSCEDLVEVARLLKTLRPMAEQWGPSPLRDGDVVRRVGTSGPDLTVRDYSRSYGFQEWHVKATERGVDQSAVDWEPARLFYISTGDQS